MRKRSLAGPFSLKCSDERDYPLPTSTYIQFSPTQTTEEPKIAIE